MKGRELTATQAEFILEYEANGRNATNAYLKTHPGCSSRQAAAVQGLRTLRNPKVAHALAALRKNRYKRLNMDADEAVMLTSMRARADFGLAFDEKGERLPLAQWPLELRVAIKGIKADGSITLVDPQQATRTILEMAGKLKQTVDVNHFDHVGYLAQKQREKEATSAEQAGTTEASGEGGSEGRGPGRQRRQGQAARS
jgi:phage terminase small subunit